MRRLSLLWAYRSFIIGSVKREFQAKYRNSLLGFVWNIINPLSMIIVYTVIFTEVMRAKLPGIDNSFAYSIYLCSGVLTWGFFSEVTMRCQNVFLESANLIKKINFPHSILPIIIVANAALNFVIVGLLFLLFLILSDNFPGWVILAVFPVLALQSIFALGLGVVLGVLNVFFRDVGQFFGIFLTFWFWLTPIVYPETVLPESIRSYLVANPMAPVISSYQTIFVKQAWPDWSSLVPTTLLSILVTLLGLYLYKKKSGEMVDEL